jgi:hypothetical protein
MKKILFCITILLFAVTAFAADDKKPIKRLGNFLAVLDIEAVGKVDKDVVRPLTDSVRREIVKANKFEVMDRGNMDKILKEQAFQMTGCTSKECAVEAGQLLGVGKIVVGSVSLVGRTYLLSLSVVNVETGKVEQVEDQECRCEVDDLIQLSRKVAGKLMREAVVETAPADVKPAQATQVQKPAQAVQVQNLKCVRTDGRFCDHGDGTVTDTKTGLMWQQRDDNVERNWNDAMAYCSNLNLNGLQGWRLPNKEELVSIVDETQKPAVNAKFFPDTKYSESGLLFVNSDRCYWSSTTYAIHTGSAWLVNFGIGGTGFHTKSKPEYARCVRTRQ